MKLVNVTWATITLYILLLLNNTTIAQTANTDTSQAYTSITNTFNEWHKTRYRMGGNTKQGIDCSHFTAIVYKNAYNKVVVGSARDYYHAIDTTFTSPLLLQVGDMVFFNINGRSLSHVGVYVGNNEFVHATVHAGVIKSNLNEPYYTRYYAGGARYRNVTATSYVTTLPELALINKTDSTTVITYKKIAKKNLKKPSKKAKKHNKKTRKKTTRKLKLVKTKTKNKSNLKKRTGKKSKTT